MSGRSSWFAGFAKSRIYINAYALVINQLTSAGLGFLYWMLAARLYGVEVVGASSAAISTLLLVSGVAQLGLGVGMHRFIPRAGRHTRKLIVSAYVVTIVASGVLGLVALWILRVAKAGTLPSVSYIPPSLAVVATVLWSVFSFQDGVLIGLRKSVWVLVENLTYNVAKIVLLVAGVWVLQDAGIVGSWFIPTPFVVALVTWVVFGKLLRSPEAESGDEADVPTVREVATSVTGDHAGSMVAEAAVRALPLTVVALLGAAQNAYFYQAWMIATTITLIAGGMVNSFSAEAAGDRGNIRAYSWGILRHMALFLIPAALVTALAAPFILTLFGPEYAREGTALLRWLALAAIPAAFVVWYLAYSRVVGNIRTVFLVQTTRAALLLGLSYVLLPTIGIESVGICWLVVNVLAALYGLIDSRSMLWPAHDESATEVASPVSMMHRGDWRFLLQSPRAAKVAVFACGPLADSSAALGATVVDGRTADAVGCDVAVVESPDAEALAACFAALVPGGMCYAEMPALGGRSARRARALMQSAGFCDVTLYWPLPRASAAQIWLPLAVEAKRLAPALQVIVRDHFPSRLAGFVLPMAARLALALGPFPSVCAVATRPAAGGASGRSDFPFLTADVGGTPGGSAMEYEFAVMRAGGGHLDTKVNWLLYSGAVPQLTLVAKSSRNASSAEYLRHERDTLMLLGRGGDHHGVETPRCVHWVEDEVSPLLVQTALAGIPMRRALNATSFDEVASRATASLIELAGRPVQSAREEWWERIVEPSLAVLGRYLDGLVEPSLLQDVRDCLSHIGTLPLVLAHNDCAPWNIVFRDDVTGIYDWEEADTRGLPAVDLIYCLATAAFLQDGVSSSPSAVGTYSTLLDPFDERGAVFSGAVDDYARELGLSAQDIPRLRLLTWLRHAASEMPLLFAGVTDPSPEIAERSIILPLLRAELAICKKVPSSAPASTSTGRALFIAPHLDDAAMSCGAGIRRLADSGVDVLVVSVCTEDEPDGAELSRLAVRNHRSWGLETRPFQSRRAEDECAMRALGAHCSHLGLKDAVYRRDPEGRFFYQRSVIAAPDPSDAATFSADLETQLGPTLRAGGDTWVFCPAGIGGHVDHVLVRRFVEGVCERARLVYYEEYPYLSREGVSQTAAGLVGPDASRLVVEPTPSEMSARGDAVACYRSQLRGLFPTNSERFAEVLSARLPAAGSLFVRPPNAEKSAVRAKRLMSAGIARAGGEAYWLAVADTGGPFGPAAR